MMNESVLPFEFPWCERYLSVFNECVQLGTSSHMQLTIHCALCCVANFCDA